MHPEPVAAALNELATDDAIFTADTGMCNVWSSRYIGATKNRRLIGSFTHGSMANALPQAIGAQLCYPGRQVIAMSGDGGLAMLMGDLLTLAQYDLPIKIVRIQQQRSRNGKTRDGSRRITRLADRSGKPELRETC